MSIEPAVAALRGWAARRAPESQNLALSRAHGRVLARPIPLDAMPDGGAGSGAFAQGAVLTPLRIATLARHGVAAVDVTRRPTVAVFTIGDAIEPGMPAEHGRTFDGGRDLLMGLLRADGFESTSWPRLPAEARQVEIALRDAGCAFDAVFVCTDDALAQVRAVLESFGTIETPESAAACDHGLLCGTLDAACVLVLPSDPTRLSGLQLTFGRALLDGLHGRLEPRAVWRGRLAAAAGDARFQLARTCFDDGGVLLVQPCMAGAHGPDADADAVLVLPAGTAPPAPGATVEVIPLPPV